MSGWTADPNEITIPADAAGTDRPRIVISGTGPVGGFPIDAAIFFYWNATDYWYMGISSLGGNGGILVRGFSAPSTGDNDHVEEIFYNQTSRAVTWQRAVVDFLGSHSTDESVSGSVYDVSPDGVPAGRGFVRRSSSAATVATVTTEAVLRTVSAFTYQNGRAYEVTFVGQVNASAVCDFVPRLRAGTAITDPLLGDYGRQQIPVAATDRFMQATFRFVAGATVSKQLSITGAASTGTVTVKGTSTGLLEMTVRDIGAGQNYPNLPTLT